MRIVAMKLALNALCKVITKLDNSNGEQSLHRISNKISIEMKHQIDSFRFNSLPIFRMLSGSGNILPIFEAMVIIICRLF